MIVTAPSPREWARLRPTQVAGVDLLQAHFVRHQFDRHSHAEWCLGVTFAGHQTFRCRGTTSTSRRGHVIVFRPDDAHDGHGEDEQGFRYAMLYVDDARIAAWLRESGGAAATFRQSMFHDPEGAVRLARAAEAATQPGESLRAEALLREAVLDLFGRHGGHRRASLHERTEPAWLPRIRDYLEAHYATDVRVEDLARLASVSRVHLTRAFMDAYGVPPHVHLNSLRLRAAMRLMAAGEPLSRVAADVGYADQSHLARRFKGAFGLTPTAWLREQRAR